MQLSKQKLNNKDSGLQISSQQLIKNAGGMPSGPPLVLALSFLWLDEREKGRSVCSLICVGIY